MKEVNANGDGKSIESIVLMGGDFKFYCLQLKDTVGDSRNFSVFPSGDESSV